MPPDFDTKEFSDRLDKLAELIPDERPDTSGIKGRTLKMLHERVKGVTAGLARLSRWLDPIQHPEEFFDPSSPRAAAEIMSAKLLQQPRRPMKSLAEAKFWGSGVYALYYTGDHPAYTEIKNTEIPIYVGKAEPEVKGAKTAEEHGTKLHERLSKHANSIGLAEAFAKSEVGTGVGVKPLALADFECRYLALSSAYVGACEANLIHHFSPVWNEVCPGFGKHGDSPDTRANTRSEWDTLHPGRKWATRDGNINNPKSPEVIQNEILEHSRAVRTRLGL